MIKVKIGKNKYIIHNNELWKNKIRLRSGSIDILKDYLRYRFKRYLYHYEAQLPRRIAKIIGEPYISNQPVFSFGSLF